MAVPSRTRGASASGSITTSGTARALIGEPDTVVDTIPLSGEFDIVETLTGEFVLTERLTGEFDPDESFTTTIRTDSHDSQ